MERYIPNSQSHPPPPPPPSPRPRSSHRDYASFHLTGHPWPRFDHWHYRRTSTLCPAFEHDPVLPLSLSPSQSLESFRPGHRHLWLSAPLFFLSPPPYLATQGNVDDDHQRPLLRASPTHQATCVIFSA